MAFPETRLTLIGRLVHSGQHDDWRLFLTDYWGPVCRFAMQWGRLPLHDAEEVASELEITANAVHGAKRRVMHRLRELMPLVEEHW